MNINRIISKVYCEPWAITQQGFDTIHGTVQRHLVTPHAPISQDQETNINGDPMPKLEIRDGVAIVPIKGPLFQHAGMMEKFCGACSYDDIKRDLNSAIEYGAETIWLNISSPGGQCVGNQECADRVSALCKEGYDIYAFTDSEMCSAAYNIAAGCRGIVSTRTAWIGSVGAMMALLDKSEAYKMQGLKTELFKSGPLKGVGTSGVSLTDDQRTYLQGLVDTFAGMFKANVNEHRHPKDGSMNGQAIIGETAVGFGLVDEICEDLEDAIATFG